MSRHKEHHKEKHGVKVSVDRHDGHTRAKAEMRWHGVDLVGKGDAELEGDDRFPKRVSDELAIARALTHLTRQLFVSTAGDIESVTGEATSVR